MKPHRLVAPFFTLLLAVLLAATFSFDAEARRFGGGKSFGRQSSQVTQRQAPPATPNSAQRGQQAAGAAGTAARKPWAGLLGGLAAGLGLAWLAQQLGLGAEFANFLLIALLLLAAVAAFRLLRRSQQGTAMAYQGAGAGHAPPGAARTAAADAPLGDATGGAALEGAQGWGIPAGFDVRGFTEAARRNFVTLQRAWDESDFATMRALMTDEMLAETQAQIAERERENTSGRAQQTEVVTLGANLLGIEETADDYLASVEFYGSMREDGAVMASDFREVWNMAKSKGGSGHWLVAGVQALD